MCVRKPSLPVLVALALIALLVSGGRADATLYVMMLDEDLVDGSQAVVVGTVLLDEVAAGTTPSTDYTVHVDSVLKGEVAAESVTVRILGGIRPDGIGLRVFGAPRFAAGDRVLLFLEPHPRAAGTYRIFHSMLGAFREARAGGGELWVRDLSDVSEVAPAPVQVDREDLMARRRQAHLPRQSDGFLRWIADRAAGRERQPDYFVDPATLDLQRITASFTLFEHQGLNIRWFDFDTGGSVEWRAHRDGQSGVPGGGFKVTKTALKKWTKKSKKTPVSLTYGGKTSASKGFLESDGVNAILWNDPNDEISAFSCASGGTLAMGGPWFGGQGIFKGRTYWRAVEGDVVFADGLECFFNASPDARKAAEEIAGHEVGHALAFGHSCGDDDSPPCTRKKSLDEALMRALIHDDGRGARIKKDDKKAAQALYKQ